MFVCFYWLVCVCVCVYRDLVEIKNRDELLDYRDRILDIYGKMPIEVEGIFRYIGTKIAAKELGIKSIVIVDDKVQILFDREKVNVDVVFKLLEDKKISYNNRGEKITYFGNVEEFFKIYKKYAKEVK